MRPFKLPATLLLALLPLTSCLWTADPRVKHLNKDGGKLSSKEASDVISAADTDQIEKDVESEDITDSVKKVGESCIFKDIQEGVCQNAKFQVSDSGELRCNPVGKYFEDEKNLCSDGDDNDCDGETDECNNRN